MSATTHVCHCIVQIVTNDFKTELREENHWLLFVPIPVEANAVFLRVHNSIHDDKQSYAVVTACVDMVDIATKVE